MEPANAKHVHGVPQRGEPARARVALPACRAAPPGRARPWAGLRGILRARDARSDPPVTAKPASPRPLAGHRERMVRSDRGFASVTSPRRTS